MQIPGFESKTSRVNDVRIHYWVGGDPDGVPVLLWHGFLGSAYSWRRVMTQLAESGYAVLAPDMRGYGDSDKPAGTDGYDGRALAEDFRALVHQIGFGAPPALLWAADHPEEISTLLYMEVPVMLPEVLSKILSYTPDAMQKGSMWWWILPLAPGVPERLIVGKEREFLSWFYQGATAKPDAIEPEAVDEYLRTFSGTEGVLGALGVYRAAFRTMEQTAPLKKNKARVPVLALGGEQAQGARVGEMVAMVAQTVDKASIAQCGHFLPEECPDEIVRRIRALPSARA